MVSTPRKHLPDFIVGADDVRADPLNRIVAITGDRGEDAKEKANPLRACWVPGVDDPGDYGRSAFAGFKAVYEIDVEFDLMIEASCAESVAG